MKAVSMSMTVAELIQKLRSWPDDTPVLVEGYETGWDSIHRLVEAQAVPYPSPGDWDGEYDLIGKVDPSLVKTDPVRAVLIVGRRGHLRKERA